MQALSVMKKVVDDDQTSLGGRPSTAATTNAANQQTSDAAPNLKDMRPEKQIKCINNEFMDYLSSFVTKNNTKTLPGTINQVEAEAKRRKLMNEIKHGEDEDEFEPDVTDIANYVQSQLQIGWKTTGKSLQHTLSSKSK